MTRTKGARSVVPEAPRLVAECPLDGQRMASAAAEYVELRLREVQKRINTLPAAAITERWSRQTFTSELAQAYLSGAAQALAMSRAKVPVSSEAVRKRSRS